MADDVGTRLKTIREIYGYSQRELAKRAKVTNGTISLIELNQTSPQVASLRKILSAFPMSIAEFFTFDVRASKAFKFGERMELEGIFEAFNLFNNRNPRSLSKPLTFNFDGTVSAGFGEPRQVQLGARFKF